MVDYRRVELLYNLAHQIQMATEAIEKSKGSTEDLLTTADLTRLLNTDRDLIKKNLKILKDLDLIRPQGLNPKRYRFDHFHYRRLLETGADDEAIQAFLDRLSGLAEPVEFVSLTKKKRR